MAEQDSRCALYLRVSTAPQVEGNSLTTQKRQLLRYARLRDWEVKDVYCDAGLSAKDTNRPELQRLLADAASHKFDTVLVLRIDRISRSLPDLIEFLDSLRDHGVEFVASEQDFDTSDPAGLLTLHVLGSFAQFERELLVERTREGQLRKVHSEPWSCGPAPYGFRREEGKLVQVPEEAEVVRRIFGLYLELGTYKDVARKLQEESVPAPRGERWWGETVKGILVNPVYAGCNVYGRYEKGDTRMKPREEWTVVPGMRKPIIDPGVLAEARAVMTM